MIVFPINFFRMISPMGSVSNRIAKWILPRAICRSYDASDIYGGIFCIYEYIRIILEFLIILSQQFLRHFAQTDHIKDPFLCFIHLFMEVLHETL